MKNINQKKKRKKKKKKRRKQRNIWINKKWKKQKKDQKRAREKKECERERKRMRVKEREKEWKREKSVKEKERERESRGGVWGVCAHVPPVPSLRDGVRRDECVREECEKRIIGKISISDRIENDSMYWIDSRGKCKWNEKSIEKN